MKQNRRKHSPSFKAKVALEVLRVKRRQPHYPAIPADRPAQGRAGFLGERLGPLSVERRREVVDHTDQGTQFTSEAFTRILEQHGGQDQHGREGELQRQPVYRETMAISKI